MLGDDAAYSSDTSDDDFVPTGEVSDIDDESDEPDDLLEDEQCNRDIASTTCRPTKSKTKKKVKNQSSEVGVDSDKGITDGLNPAGKDTIEKLWAEFKKDEPKEQIEDSKPKSSGPILKVFEFAGEKVEVLEEDKSGASSSTKKTAEKRPPIRTGGLASLTSKFSNKKAKLSTLEKSKLDWDRFKADEGISEELKSFNQGKHGYLEKQAFLERADVKQFEIEKHLRTGNKK